MLFDLCQWLESLSWSTTIRESLWVFPALESIHLCTMILMVVGIAAVDLRLLGIALGRQPVSQLAGRVLRVVWLSFGANAVTGSLLFVSRAKYYFYPQSESQLEINSPFLIKLLLIFLAVAFHSVVFRRTARWDDAPPLAMPLGAKLVGSFSLLLWVGVIAVSRWIAFV